MTIGLSKTRQDVLYRALEELGALVFGQTPAQDDVSKVDNLFEPMCDELSTRGLVYISDPGEEGPSGGVVPADVFMAVSSWLANLAAPAFGSTYSPDVEEALAARIRVITAGAPTFVSIATDAY